MKTTKKKFWEILATCRGFVNEGGWIRRYYKKYSHGTCPVCAVRNRLIPHGKRLRLDDVEAAKEIGLDLTFASKVAYAADAGHYHPLRKKLLRVLKLKEVG